eukprot:GHRQ01033435.1.p1 GENE.GHRQ01033435.1~~GHRQ01033435.1.p1  ORF type:complete len:206 (+),score=29.72 GHRQ01033435.1:48-665(+)
MVLTAQLDGGNAFGLLHLGTPAMFATLLSANRGGTACCSTSETATPCLAKLLSSSSKRSYAAVTTSRAAAAVSSRQQRLLLPQAIADSVACEALQHAAFPTNGSSSAHASLWSRLDWELLLLVCAAPAGPALAEEGVAYNATQGEGIVKTISGAAYIGLLLYFLTRVLNRRARKAREERLAGQGPVTTVFTKLVSWLLQLHKLPV